MKGTSRRMYKTTCVSCPRHEITDHFRLEDHELSLINSGWHWKQVDHKVVWSCVGCVVEERNR